MNDKKHDQLEQKLQSLEELLLQWKEENSKREERLEKRFAQNIIKYTCILVAALGALWSVVELVDWYCKRYELTKIARSYSRAADKGYQQTRNPEVALEIINKALALTPDDPDLLYKQIYYQSHAVLLKLPALNVFHAKHYQMLNKLSADLILQKDLTPENGELYLLSALLLQKQKQYEKSIAAVNEAVVHKVEYPYAESILIENLLALKKDDLAMERTQRLLKNSPDNKYTHYIYGRVKLYQKQYLEAKKSFEKALKYDHVHYDSLKGVVLCASASIPRDFQTEQEYCRKLLHHYPQEWFAYNYLIRSCIQNDNYSLARLYLRKAERIFRQTSGLYVLKAELYMKQKDFQLAEKYCLKAYQLTPENINVQRQLVNLYISSGDFQKAVKYNNEIGQLAIEMDNKSALNNAAWRFYLLGTEYPQARKMIEQAVAGSRNSYHFGTYADILFRQGKIKRALEISDRAISLAGTARKTMHTTAKALKLIELDRLKEAAVLLPKEVPDIPNYYRVFLAWGEYHIKTGDLKKAYRSVMLGKKNVVNQFEMTELLMLEAKIKAAEKDWKNAQRLQKKALQNINNSFSEIRLAYQLYVEYSLLARDKAEAEKTLAKLRQIDKKSPGVIKLEEMLSKYFAPRILKRK